MTPSSTSKPPARLSTLLALAWPIIIARATQSVIGFCDALMVAPLGKESLAAATTGAMNSFAVLILPMGTVFIVQSFAAQLSGRGDRAGARRFAWYGLLLALFAGMLGLGLIPALDFLIGFFDFESAVQVLMVDYMAIRLTSVVAVVGTETLGNWYGGLGNTRLQMIAGVVTMTVNIFLHWVFIYGHLGAPAMGVQGAALASTLASWSGFAFLLFVFLRYAEDNAPSGPRGLRLSELARTARFGLPSGVNWFFEFAAFALFINVVMAHLGTTVLAAFNVVISINSVSFMPAFGLSSAGAILAGQAIGRGHPEAVARITFLTAQTAGVWMATMGILYLAIPDLLIGWFAPAGADGDALLAVAPTLLMVSAAWQLFDAIAMTLSEVLRAAGDTAWSMWARVILAWVVFAPSSLAIVLLAGGGPVAAMGCLIGYLGLLAVVLLWRFRSGAWRRIDLVGSASGRSSSGSDLSVTHRDAHGDG